MFRIRKEQIEVLSQYMLKHQVPLQAIRRSLRDIIQAEGRQTELELKTGDLLIHEENLGLSRITFDQKGRAETECDDRQQLIGKTKQRPK